MGNFARIDLKDFVYISSNPHQELVKDFFELDCLRDGEIALCGTSERYGLVVLGAVKGRNGDYLIQAGVRPGEVDLDALREYKIKQKIGSATVLGCDDIERVDGKGTVYAA
ncbi:MAG: hypothetical protein HY513_02835 [Candidatus Aenigmarchaeota archaeon]|nr:hypothetical protein [Candidatus Aenigmarchaeota archaeon]